MGIAAVRHREKSDSAGKRGGIVLAAGLLLMLLILSRYLVNGEPVDIRSDEAETTISLPLADDMVLRQPLTITEEMNWRQGYYAVCFAECDRNSTGKLICTLEQTDTSDQELVSTEEGTGVADGTAVFGTEVLSLHEIEAGEWIRLKALDFGKLACGSAVLSLRTEGVAEGELAVAAGADYYGFGVMDYNGVTQDLTLAQAYHYHITGMEYLVRLLCYGFVVLCAAALVWLAGGERMGSRKRCLAVFGIMTAMFMAIIYLLDSSIYLEPTYAEAVTNFLQFAREEKLAANLLITDAGYLPLLPRLITLFYVKVLRLPSSYVLYVMQATACLLCSMVWSFFVLYPFRKVMRLSDRVLWCVLVMLTCFCEETLFFTNLAYWGIYLLLLLLLAELEQFPRWIYAGLMAVCALICLSKGTYVVLLPLMLLYLVFFGRSVGIRDRIYACVTGSAALLQLLYSFSGQGDGGSWMDTASMGQIGYWFRLIGRVFAEFAAYLLLPFGRYVQRMAAPVLLLGVVTFVFLAVDFFRTVLLPVVRRQKIAKARAIFYSMVMFQVMVSAFYLITVRRVPDSWKEIGRVVFGQMGHKYEIFSDLGFYMLLLAGLALGKTGDRFRPAVKKVGWLANCGQYGVLGLFIVFCLTNPVMRLTGWADAAISDSRIYAGDINAGWQDCRQLIHEQAFFIPVRPDHWGYGQNATLYQVGTDTYFEEVSCINLEEAISGYHSVYEMPEETEQSRNVIEVMIRQPVMIGERDYRVRLLDADDNLLAETGQLGSGRNKKCIFRFEEPVSGAVTMQFVDEDGNPVYYKDYIAWVRAW